MKERSKMYSSRYVRNTRYQFDNTITEIVSMCCRGKSNIQKKALKKIILLAVEISAEGREGRKIGTMFIIGNEEAVLQSSRLLILDPLKGHLPEERNINNPNLHETIKELAQLDGAFIVSGNGIVISAGRYIYANNKDVIIPCGLGSRHIAAASITKHTNAVAVVVSESSAVRILKKGRIISEIIPEIVFKKKG
jgi:diadenylate cyclase